jgi:glycosyltransferase 2 family protein
MSSTAKRFFRYAVSFLVAIAFLMLAFRGVSYTELWQSLRGANYWWIALLVPLNLLSHWVRAVRWADLLAPIKKNISLRNLFSGVMIGYAINNVLPRVGEFVRPYMLGKLEGISKSSAFATVVVERILDFMSFYSIVCFVLFAYPHALDPFVQNVEAVRPFFLFGSVIALLMFVFLFFKAEGVFRFGAKILHFVPQRIAIKAEKKLESFYSGFAVAKVKEKFGMILFQSFTIWGLYVLGMYIPFFAFEPLVKPELNFSASVILLVISSIAWVLPAPGAMGTYHSFLSIAMVRLYAVDMTTALSFAIVTHGIGYLTVNVVGAYFYFRDHLKISEIASMTDIKS